MLSDQNIKKKRRIEEDISVLKKIIVQDIKNSRDFNT